MKNLKKLAGATLVKNNTLPILDNILIKESNLTFSDLDTRVTINNFLPTNDFPKNKDINICVNAMDFCEVVDLLQKEKAFPLYQQDENKLTISTGSEKFNLTANEHPDDYPAPIATPKFRGHLTKNDIATMKKCAIFADNNDLRPVMNGVLIEKKKAIGTDAHILHWNNLEGKVNVPLIVPKKVIILLDILRPEKIEITTNKDNTTALLACDNIEIIFRAIEGRFPNWQVVLPNNFAGAISFDKKEMLTVLSKGKKFAHPETHQMVFNINGKGYRTTFCDINRGTEYVKEFTGDIKGDVDNFGLNAAMLEKILKTIPEEKIKIDFSAPNRGMIINDNYLLMPVMLDA